MKQIILNKNKSKRSVNVDNKLSINLSTTERILPFDNIINEVDLYNVYNNERNTSNKYRLIFTINPICSNILFNAITEIIYKEGSDETIVVPKRESVNGKIKYDGKKIDFTNIVGSPKSIEPLYTTQAIRDTEYSHPKIGPYVYHCGYDIFNNHKLRTLGFNLIPKKDTTSIPSDISKSDLTLYKYDYNTSDIERQITGITENYFKDTFNTIRDFARDKDGEKVEDFYFHLKNEMGSKSEKRTIHTYQYDDLMSFNESIFSNLVEENGWFGFINTSSIDIPNYGDLSVNKCMNNNKSCEHIDMYPDRSLYSFVPKINKYRNNRIEKNWDVCLTYPFSSTTEYLGKNGKEEYKIIKSDNINAIKIIKFNINITTNDVERIFFYSPIKHNLKIGDKIQIYYREKETDNYKSLYYLVSVIGVGNPSDEKKDYWFSVNMDDCHDIFIKDDKIISDIDLRFAKSVGGFDCLYYFREFKKIPNFKFSKKNIYDNNFVMDNDYIDKNNNFEFDHTISKLSFAENIYSDNISQIVFTDDIDLTKLTDNLGRPLSEIYLTIIKRNKGYKKWYTFDINNNDNNWAKYSDDAIEYSHAFGKITSGLDLPIECYDENDIYCNIHYQNNINENGDYGCYENTPSVLKIPKTAQSLENRLNKNQNEDDGITIEGGFDDNIFLGDIVEFSPSEMRETILEDIFHRFNTAQRESTNPLYCDIIYDEIAQDDYDVSQSDDGKKSFKVVQEYMNTLINESEPSYDANLFPEGYYYKPHYKIKIKEFNDVINQGNDIQISYKLINSITQQKFKIKTAINYYFEVNDKIYLVNKTNFNIINGSIIAVDNLINVTFNIEENINELNDYIIFKHNPEKPSYAYLLNDGSGRYLWRELLKPSEVSNTSEIYDMTFTNDAFYVHKNINFYLKRQDPFNKYGLYSVNSPLVDLLINGNKKDTSTFDYIIEEENASC